MVKIGFSSMVLLGLVLKIMLLMTYSTAQVPHFQGEELGDPNDHTVLGHDVELHGQKKEFALASTKSKTEVIGGRKMVLDHKGPCEKTETEGSSRGKDPGPLQEPQGEANDPCNQQQKTSKILGPKDPPVFSGKMGISRSDVDDQAHNIPSTKTEGYPPQSKSIPADDNQSPIAESSQRHLEAANDELLNLMHKDYRGFPKPRRRPPINNHEPSH